MSLLPSLILLSLTVNLPPTPRPRSNFTLFLRNKFTPCDNKYRNPPNTGSTTRFSFPTMGVDLNSYMITCSVIVSFPLPSVHIEKTFNIPSTFYMTDNFSLTSNIHLKSLTKSVLVGIVIRHLWKKRQSLQLPRRRYRRPLHSQDLILIIKSSLPNHVIL